MLLNEKNRHDLGFDTVLALLAARTRTERANRAALSLAPFARIEDAVVRITEVTEARAVRDTGEPLPLQLVRNVDEPLERAAKSGTLDPASLRDIGLTAQAAGLVRDHLTRNARFAPRLLGRALVLDGLPELAALIARSFEMGEHALRITDNASPALGGLRRRALRAKEFLETRVATLLDASSIAPHLQDRYFTQRDDRYVLPIRIDARSKVRGILHGLSASAQTVFVEPEELVDLNNQLKLAELEVSDEERRILVELTARVAEVLPQLQTNVEILAVFDLIDAAAQLSIEMRATPPELIDRGAIDLRRARHPLMAMTAWLNEAAPGAARQSERKPVPNDIHLPMGHSLVISGPNAGGKTVALKTTALCVAMARHGLHIAAQDGSKTPWFETILCDIGDDQSLERDLSTFSAHLMHLKEFTEAASPTTLLLLDEVAVGTDPSEGAALAQAVLEAFADRGATVIVTTHFDQLKVLPTTDTRFHNASVGFDLQALRPTFELHADLPGASGALYLARRLGLPEALCARAQSLTGAGAVDFQQLLERLSAERTRLQTARQNAETEHQEMTRLKDEAEAERARAEELRKAARESAHDEAVDSLKKARAEIDQTRSILRRGGVELQSLKALEKTVDAQAAQVHQKLPVAAPEGRAFTAAELTVGREVYVASMKKTGKVASVPKGKQVEVQVGPLRLRAQLDDLYAPPAAVKPVQKSRGHNAFSLAAPPKGESRGGVQTINVRGERVDVALGLIEKFLDDALRSGQESVQVVHGHGTGALRESIRRQLGGFPGVKLVRAATTQEGGDGVTMIEFS